MNAFRHALAALLPVTLVVLFIACGDGDSSAGGDGGTVTGKLKVVGTTIQVGALTAEVGKDLVDLKTLIKPGVDPHEYEATADDLRDIKAANIVLRNGVGIDAFLDKAIKSSGTKARVITVTTGVRLRAGDEEEAKDKQGAKDADKDPHVWHDPQNDKIMVDNVVKALSDKDAKNAFAYEANGAAYKKVLDDTDAQVRALIDTIPPANRKMVTNHDAFGYFIERYGLKFVGAVIPSLTTNAEPSAKDLAALIELIKKENVKAIFAESSVDPKIARQIAQDTKVKIVDDLYGDSLGEPGSGAETVHGMLLSNAKKIAEALR